MNYAASFAEFAKIWHLNDWNHFRIRCVGRIPVLTTWINGLKICELDSAKIETPGYDAEAVAQLLGRAGHIGFEVHDVDLKNPLGQDRWGIGGGLSLAEYLHHGAMKTSSGTWTKPGAG